MKNSTPPQRTADLAGRIGVSTNLIHRPSDLVESVRTMAEHFKRVEIELEYGLRSILEAPVEEYEATVAQLRDLRASLGLEFTVHAPYRDRRANFAAGGDLERRIATRTLARAVAFCGDIGATHLTLHPGRSDGRELEDRLANLGTTLREVRSFAAARGVELCVENMGANRPLYLVLDAARMVDFAQETGTKVTLDTVHLATLYRTEPEFLRRFERLLPFVGNLHLADMIQPRHTHLPLEAGRLPLDEIAALLADGGYGGTVVIEELGGKHGTEAFLDAARRFRDRLLG